MGSMSETSLPSRGYERTHRFCRGDEPLYCLSDPARCRRAHRFCICGKRSYLSLNHARGAANLYFEEMGALLRPCPCIMFGFEEWHLTSERPGGKGGRRWAEGIWAFAS